MSCKSSTNTLRLHRQATGDGLNDAGAWRNSWGVAASPQLIGDSIPAVMDGGAGDTDSGISRDARADRGGDLRSGPLWASPKPHLLSTGGFECTIFVTGPQLIRRSTGVPAVPSVANAEPRGATTVTPAGGPGGATTFTPAGRPGGAGRLLPADRPGGAGTLVPALIAHGGATEGESKHGVLWGDINERRRGDVTCDMFPTDCLIAERASRPRLGDISCDRERPRLSQFFRSSCSWLGQRCNCSRVCMVATGI